VKRLRTFYFIITTLFLVTTLLFLALGVSGYLWLSGLSGNIADQSYRINKISEREEILKNLETKYQKVEPDIEAINMALPDQKEVSKLLSDLDTMAKSSNLKLKTLESSNPANAKNQKSASGDLSLLQTVKGANGYEIPLNIKVEGGFSNFTGFLKGLENYQRLINITTIEITKPPNTESNDNIEATIKITAYLKK
jgi:Tfp pilus assembly protein PilO